MDGPASLQVAPQTAVPGNLSLVTRYVLALEMQEMCPWKGCSSVIQKEVDFFSDGRVL